MTKLMTTVGGTFLALSLGVSAPALAVTQGSDAAMAHHSLMRASKAIGGPVYNAKGEEIGTINDFVVDPNGGPPEAVVSVGKYLGKGDKMVEVPLGGIQVDNNGRMMMQHASMRELEKMHAFVWRDFNGAAG